MSVRSARMIAPGGVHHSFLGVFPTLSPIPVIKAFASRHADVEMQSLVLLREDGMTSEGCSG
jgi:hypothetical protein